MSGIQKLVNFIKDEEGWKKSKLPTSNSKIYKRDGLKTIFHTLDYAIEESKKWDMLVTITHEFNGYFRFFGHSNKVFL